MIVDSAFLIGFPADEIASQSCEVFGDLPHPAEHHSAQHHKLVRPIYLHEEGKSPKTLMECEEILATGKPIKKALSTIMSYKSMLAAAAA